MITLFFDIVQFLEIMALRGTVHKCLKILVMIKVELHSFARNVVAGLQQKALPLHRFLQLHLQQRSRLLSPQVIFYHPFYK